MTRRPTEGLLEHLRITKSLTAPAHTHTMQIRCTHPQTVASNCIYKKCSCTAHRRVCCSALAGLLKQARRQTDRQTQGIIKSAQVATPLAWRQTKKFFPLSRHVASSANALEPPHSCSCTYSPVVLPVDVLARHNWHTSIWQQAA